MFDFHKRIFANKREAPYAKPMCPYLTTTSGYTSLKFTNPPRPAHNRGPKTRRPLHG